MFLQPGTGGTQSKFGEVVLRVVLRPLCLVRNILWCPCIYVVPEPTHLARLRALEGRCVKSKSQVAIRWTLLDGTKEKLSNEFIFCLLSWLTHLIACDLPVCPCRPAAVTFAPCLNWGQRKPPSEISKHRKFVIHPALALAQMLGYRNLFIWKWLNPCG